MRSMNQIIIAVKDSEPATEEELRLCIVGLSSRQYFAEKAADEKAADEMAADFEAGTLKAKVAAAMWVKNRESRFKSMKMPVDEYLGPGNTPGNPEYEKRIKIHKAIFEKATGQKL